MSTTTTVPTVDDDDFSLLTLLAAFIALLSIPILLVLIITTSIAWHKTREWQREKARSQNNSSPLLAAQKKEEDDDDDEDELDPEDSGDEAELRLRDEKRRDDMLSTKEYFWKQMRTVWKGDRSVGDRQRVKEREERRRLARDVARELVRLERRGAGARLRVGRGAGGNEGGEKVKGGMV